MRPTSIIQRLVILLITLISAIGANAQEAYANYTPSNTTLTFYYDNLRSTRTGTTYNLNKGTNRPGWHSDGTRSNVTKVVFDPSFAGARPTTSYWWFKDMINLQTIEGLRYLNTSKVADMNAMFYECSSLLNLDLSSFNTSNVTDMGHMFYHCFNLKSLNLSSFNTSNVTNMRNMFYECRSLRTIYVGSGWGTEVVSDSDDMFKLCGAVGGQGTTVQDEFTDKTYARIDGGTNKPGYLTEKPKEAYACYTSSNKTLTFYYDNLRNTREGTTYNLNRVGDLASWINDGNNAYVTKVVFDPLFADARPTSTYGWFYNMKNLQTIEDMSYLNTSEVTDMTYMFGYCENLASLDLSNFNTSKVTDMKNMFYSCLKLQTIYVGEGWSTAAVTSSSNMFMGCRVLVGGQGTAYDVNHVNKTYARIDGESSNPGYFTAANEAYACYTESNATLTFYFDTKRDSREGTTYDLNTGNNSPGWFTDRTMYHVTKVVFDPSFADARPTSTHEWFLCMYKLEAIEGLSYLNTSGVTNMSGMFLQNYCLTNLDLSSFNTSNVTTMKAMFDDCHKLQTIYVGEGWSTAAVTHSENMFEDTHDLVGGKGTTWNSSNPKDKTYARIDGGTIKPGYFTKGSEAYAAFENGTLTFYYDRLRDSRTVTYNLNTDNNLPGWFTDGYYSSVTKVVFDSSFAVVRPTSTYYWFLGMTSLQSIKGMSYLNTSDVTNMSYMFTGCQLTSLNLINFNTSKVTDMTGMFDGSKLTTLNLSSFNTSEVTSMSTMFRDCNKLVTIYVGDKWNTAKVTSSGSGSMFQNCTNLVGGQGTSYQAVNSTDKTYARIDGEGGPGYFTRYTIGIATDLHQVTSDKSQVQSDEWYTIDGRKLNGMPAKKGVYIQNGKKAVLN